MQNRIFILSTLFFILPLSLRAHETSVPFECKGDVKQGSMGGDGNLYLLLSGDYKIKPSCRFAAESGSDLILRMKRNGELDTKYAAQLPQRERDSQIKLSIDKEGAAVVGFLDPANPKKMSLIKFDPSGNQDTNWKKKVVSWGDIFPLRNGSYLLFSASETEITPCTPILLNRNGQENPEFCINYPGIHPEWNVVSDSKDRILFATHDVKGTRIVRLNPDGSLDSSFESPLIPVESFVIDHDDSIVAIKRGYPNSVVRYTAQGTPGTPIQNFLGSKYLCPVLMAIKEQKRFMVFERCSRSEATLVPSVRYYDSEGSEIAQGPWTHGTSKPYVQPIVAFEDSILFWVGKESAQWRASYLTKFGPKEPEAASTFSNVGYDYCDGLESKTTLKLQDATSISYGGRENYPCGLVHRFVSERQDYQFPRQTKMGYIIKSAWPWKQGVIFSGTFYNLLVGQKKFNVDTLAYWDGTRLIKLPVAGSISSPVEFFAQDPEGGILLASLDWTFQLNSSGATRLGVARLFPNGTLDVRFWISNELLNTIYKVAPAGPIYTRQDPSLGWVLVFGQEKIIVDPNGNHVGTK